MNKNLKSAIYKSNKNIYAKTEYCGYLTPTEILELLKLPIHPHAYNTQIKEWNIEKFKALGFEQKAHDYAMDLLAKLQGISMLANVYNDREFLHRATRDVQSWINQITAN